MSDPYSPKPDQHEGDGADGDTGEPGYTAGKKIAKLFDLRLLIGGLFSFYGIVLIIAGIADGAAELAKAGGVRINLWTGIGMLVIGLLFLLWARLTDDGHARAEHLSQEDPRP